MSKYVAVTPFKVAASVKEAFLSKQGNVIVDKERAGVVVTGRAVLYYETVAQSINVLSSMPPEDIAAQLSTSVKYAGILKERLLAKFRNQLSIASSAGEVVLGVILTASGSFSAIGRKVLYGDAKKVSKETLLRHSLPVGKLAMYPISNGATIYSTDKNKKYYTGVKVADLYMDNKPLVIVMTDTHRERYYLGLRWLFRRDPWLNRWSTILPHAKIILLKGNSTINVAATDVVTTPGKYLKPGKKFTDASSLLAVVESLDSIIQAEGGINLSLTLSGKYTDIPEFAEYLKEKMLSRKINMVLTYDGTSLGHQSYKDLSNLVPPTNIFNEWAHEVPEVLRFVAEEVYKVVIGGVAINKDDVATYKTGTDATVGEIADRLNVKVKELWVPAAANSKGPFMFWRSFEPALTGALTVEQSKAGGVKTAYPIFHSRSVHNRKLPSMTVVHHFAGDPGLLLA